jgi:hypothetical protein
MAKKERKNIIHLSKNYFPLKAVFIVPSPFLLDISGSYNDMGLLCHIVLYRQVPNDGH